MVKQTPIKQVLYPDTAKEERSDRLASFFRHHIPTTYPFPIQAVGANPFLCRRDTRLKRVVRAA